MHDETKEVRPLYRFKCHKTVQAATIMAIEPRMKEQDYELDLGECGKVIVSNDWYNKKSPEVGGLYVVYENGYQSYSPLTAFDAGYYSLDCIEKVNLDFSNALEFVKAGRRIFRAGWNGLGQWICLSPGMPDCPAEKLWAGPNRRYAEENGGKATVLPYLTIKNAQGTIVPWLASQGDLLAEDWIVLPE